MSNDPFWTTVREQLAELTAATSATKVAEILCAERNPYGHETITAQGFFAGGGGDDTVRDALRQAGWRTVWAEASYYYAMRAPDGSVITYIEGDIYTRDTKGEQ